MGVGFANPNQRGIFSFVRTLKAPRLGELREPITIYRSHRAPNQNPDGTNTYRFDDSVTVRGNVWCKVYQSQGNWLNGQNIEANLSHIFIIREVPGLAIEADCFVLWHGRIYSVRGFRNITDTDAQQPEGIVWVLILCDEYGSYAEEPRTVVSTATDIDAGPTAGADPLNPLWR